MSFSGKSSHFIICFLLTPVLVALLHFESKLNIVTTFCVLACRIIDSVVANVSIGEMETYYHNKV